MTWPRPHVPSSDLQRVVGEFEDRQARIRAYAAGFSTQPQVADAVVNVRRSQPHLPPGVVMGAALSGLEGDQLEQLGREVARRQAGANALPKPPGPETGSGIFEKIGGALSRVGDIGHFAGRTAARTLTTTFDALWNEGVQRPIKTGVGIAQGLDPGEAFEQSGASAGALALRDLIGGERVELGSGFLPGGELMEEAIEDQSQIRVSGKPVTVGRLLATGVNELPSLVGADDYDLVPVDSLAYNILSGTVDTAFAFAADPAALGLGKLARVRAAARLWQPPVERTSTVRRLLESGGLVKSADDAEQIVAAGGLPGRKPSVDLNRAVSEWMDNTDEGRLLVDTLARLDDPYDIWATPFGQAAPRSVVREIAETADPNRVRGILSETLGLHVRTKPTAGRASRAVAEFLGASGMGSGHAVFGAKHMVRRSLASNRLVQRMPGAHVDVVNFDRGLKELERFMRNANLPEERVGEWMNRLMRHPDGDISGIGNSVFELLDDIASHAATGRGLSPAGRFDPSVPKRTRRALNEIRDATRVFRDDANEFHAWLIDEVGDNVDAFGAKVVRVGDETHTLASPQRFIDYLSSGLPLPDARMIREQTSRFAALLEIPGVRMTNNMATAFMDAVWKPMMLVTRVAWPVRVIAEEQGRMAASGLDSMFNHPLSYIALAASGSEGRLSRLAQRAGVRPRGTTDLLGEDLHDIARSMGALQTDFGALGYRGTPGTSITRDYVRLRKGADSTDDVLEAYAWQFARVRSDPVQRRLAKEGLDPTKDWFFASKEGSRVRNLLVKMGADEKLLSRSGADRYVDMLWADLNHLTGGRAVFPKNPTEPFQVLSPGNRRLIDGIAAGNLKGVKVGNVSRAKLQDALEEFYDDIPGVVVGQRKAPMRRGRAGRIQGVAQSLDDATTKMMALLMGAPTNTLSRSPTFRQAYWRRVAEVASSADDATIRTMAQRAREAGMDDIARRLGDTAPAANPKLTDVADADLLAKSHGLEFTEDLLYDLANRAQFFDVARLAFPFGEAWREILTTWMHLAAERPQVLRRGQQLVEGARKSGFFFENEFGEESFTIPGSDMLSDWMFGDHQIGDAAGQMVGTQLFGSVTGINLFAGEAMPGFGPAVQIPAGAFLPDTPDLDWLRDVVIPFGSPEATSIGDVATDALLPAWVKKALGPFGLAGGDAQAQWDSTVVDTAKALLLTGDYSHHSPEEMERLMNRARSSARWLWAVRIFGQAVGPTGPRAEFRVELPDVEDGRLDEFLTQVLDEDEDAKFLSFNAAANAYFEMLDETGGDHTEATARFVDLFGFDPTPVTIGKTVSLQERADTPTGAEWERRNPDLVRRYPTVVGFFAPSGGADEETDLDFNHFRRLLREGARRRVTREEWALLLNKRLGSMAYKHAQDRVGDRNDVPARVWLRTVKEELRDRYPGFDTTTTTLPDRPSIDEQVRTLAGAVEAEDELRGTDAGQGLAVYLDAREQALEAARARFGPLTTLRGARVNQLKQWLHQVAAEVARQHPDFAGVWQQVLSKEVEVEPDELDIPVFTDDADDIEEVV